MCCHLFLKVPPMLIGACFGFLQSDVGPDSRLQAPGRSRRAASSSATSTSWRCVSTLPVSCMESCMDEACTRGRAGPCAVLGSLRGCAPTRCSQLALQVLVIYELGHNCVRADCFEVMPTHQPPLDMFLRVCHVRSCAPFLPSSLPPFLPSSLSLSSACRSPSSRRSSACRTRL